MPVEGRAGLGFGPSFELAGYGEEGFDDLVAQDDQSAHAPQAWRHYFIATGGFNLVNQVLGTKFLQVVRWRDEDHIPSRPDHSGYKPGKPSSRR